MVSLLSHRRVPGSVRDSGAVAGYAGSHRTVRRDRPLRVRYGTLVLCAVAFALGGLTASAVTLALTWVVEPLTAPTPPAWACHVEWKLPVEKVCAPIPEDDPRWDCATMGNKKCGNRELVST